MMLLAMLLSSGVASAQIHVKGNVYGGGELGKVTENTTVTVNDGTVGEIQYDRKQGTSDTAPFDTIIHVNESGHVYGGGKGSATDSLAGWVQGNTYVTLTGGHVQFNIYGGGELGSVGLVDTIGSGENMDLKPKQKNGKDTGVAYVKVTGGQVGPTPRTDAGYNLPCSVFGLDGYVIGGSKGVGNGSHDYKAYANVNYTYDTIQMTPPSTQADSINHRIWGSVYGGGEDGHVLGNTTVVYMSGLCGPDGNVAYGGNVFGGGRNYHNRYETCGRVRGNTSVEVKGGSMLGSVFGGGRSGVTGVDYKGDTLADNGSQTYGHTFVVISGGTIGNEKIIASSSRTCGDVFGSGKGYVSNIDLGKSKYTNVTITNSAEVLGSVYGGGELGTVLKNTSVTINNGTTKGSVYGGAKGSADNELVGSVKGNTLVTMTGGTVERSIYGGGQLGSVGTFTYNTVTYPASDPNNNAGKTVQIPTTRTAGGLAKVIVTGGRVGGNGSTMPSLGSNPDDDDRGWIFCGGKGEADSITYAKAIGLGVVDSTYLEIRGTMATGSPTITASVYGGSENGLVLGNTHVVIGDSCQIGTGHYLDGSTHKWDDPYDEAKWTAAINAVKDGTITTELSAGHSLDNIFHECDAWPYGDGNSNYYVYDYYADANGNYPGNVSSGGGCNLGSNGHSFFGNVYGGGSGFYPIRPGIWRRTAGQVNGNTTVEITGGHILTNVYGGNEITSVNGTCHVIMSGGTVGIPRTKSQIEARPTNGYIFGAGMGDARTAFNTWTNVDSTYVSVTGGVVFSSVYGGGEEGHVLRNTHVTLNETDATNNPMIIGTIGYTEFDGNVFGAGRGMARLALTAGTIGGNSQVDIMAGTVLGSIYGGGSMASVGTYLVATNDTHYGEMQSGNGHGFTTINITGGTIGNDYEAVYHTNLETLAMGGNVYGGSKGSFTKLNSSEINPIWLDLAKVKRTSIEINGSSVNIKGNVYGGGEYGIVTDSTVINVSNGTIWRDVFGGGHGSDDTVTQGLAHTPLQHAGRVYGNTRINISGGWIKKCVYGGGELASVGTVNNYSLTTLTQSWPIRFEYGTINGTSIPSGKTTINVTGGRIGMTGKDYFGPWDSNGNPVTSSGIAYANDAALKDACSDNGDIYGGSKGKAIDPNTTNHDHLHLANVRKTEINVDYGTSNTADPTNYNPTTGDAGITNSNIGYATGFYPTWTEWTTSLGSNAERSCITGAVYAGAEEGHVYEDTKVTLTNGLVGHAIYGGGKGKGKYDDKYNLNAGKVYGNTEININNGYVVRSVFGGGNLASVGKGNYIGLTNGESQVHGDDSIAVANSGITTINITGGKLGMLPFVTLGNGALDSTSVFKDNIPYGSVFGGCRGQVVNSTDISDDFFAFVNKTNITIDTAGYDPSNNPRIFGSVYGGGQDGHVRHNTYVTINAGEIGVEFEDPNTALTTVGARDWTSSFWNTRGNVYGGGSGISKKSGNYSPIAGSVHDSTNVTINGGLIHRIVYGGGSMASVDSLATVTVNSPIGVASNNYHDYTAYDYGGYVFGGGRGSLETGVDLAVSAYTGRTKVNIGTGAVVPGNVYGGGAMGQVKDSTDVNMTDGEVKSNVFGGGKGADTHQNAGLVIKNTHVTLSDGTVGLNIYGGGEIASVGQVDNNGAPVDHTGFAKVDINGGTVGNSTMYNSYNANNNPDQHGHVYGGGKGIENDASSQTNPNGLYYNYANVNNTQVTVDAGRIYGSVYGGSAYGHVIDSTHVIITDNANIGNKAITGWDGHVFGGGKGNSGNFTMGRVGGNTLVEMDHGTVKGCVYGGGRIALTGVGLNNGFEAFLNTTTNVYDSLHHGRTKVVVSGGVIGNADGLELLMSENKAGNIYGGGRGKTDEYIEDDLGRVANAVVNITGNPTIYGSVFGGGQMANVGHWNNYVDWYSTRTGATLVTIQDNPSIGTELEFDHGYATGSVGGNTTPLPIYTLYDTINGVRMLGHTRTGNVFGGGQGGMRMNATGAAEGFEQGHCRTAEVSISGTPTIMSSVYGGSEQGAVWGDTKVVIAGGTIGQQNRISDSLNPVIASNHTGSYSFGSVFGGSYGMDSYTQLHSNSSVVADTVNNYAGRVYGDTKVEIRGGKIRNNVYGGGDIATVVGDSYVTIANPTSGSGPEIGPLDGTGLNANVYGAGRGFAMDSTELRKAYANVDSTYVIIEGGKIYGSVFGGGADSHVLGSTSVTVHSGADIGTDGLSTWDGNIFGGGRNFFNVNNTNGRVEGNISVTMDGGTIQGTIFGGGRMALSGVNENGVFPTTSWPADKHGNVSINVSGGEIGNGSDQGIHLLTESDESVGDIFGAGKGDTKDYLDTLAGRVTNATINIYGSPRIHGAVFGGGEMASLGWWDNTGTNAGVIYDHTGEATVTIGREGENDNPVIGTWLELDPNYINNNPSEWTMVEVVNGAKRVYHTCTGNVFGGCQGDVDFEDPNLWHYMGRSRKATVTVNGGTIMSDVYGGSEQGIVSGDTKVTINGGTIGTEATDTEGKKYIHGNIYGGGYGSDEPQEDTEYVTVFGTQMRTDSLAGRTFGNTQVDILGGTMRNNVFGGAAFAYIGTDNNANKGKTTVNIGDATHYGHTITGNVYGANNRKGAVLGDVTVNVNAGTLGAGNVNDSTITRQSDVFGGGLGELTTTCGNVTVNVDTLNYTAGTTIFGNVYGGSALGSVNNDNTDKTTVNILAGTLATHRTTGTTANNNPYYIYTGGNVFGGGLGVSGDANKGQVNGKVIINIGSGTYAYNTSTQKYEYIDLEGDASIMGSIYGCNNTGGSPQDSVTVNIYKTAHTPYDSATYVNATPANLTYAINNVFGGGNEANYTGSKTSRVNIINCDNSVERVFGGGNAAASTNVYTDILGGRFDKVFGGGNGERGTAYAANISGNDTLTIHGGQVNTFFVGSNENGTVFGHSYVAVDNEGPCQEINIDEFFCGGNYVDVIGDVNAIITCTQGMSVKSLYGGCNQAKILKKTDGTGGNVNLTVEGGVFQNVYGGSKGRPKSQEEPNGFDASIAGNVTLNVKGGTIDTIFGGSNIMGNVHGIITVNVSDAENNNCPLIVHNVYGGGRGAFYAPDSVIVAGVKKTPVAPIVNFLNGNITQQVKNLGGTLRYSGGNVFGGGFGQDAYVTANPRVTIGYDPTTMSSLSNLIPVGITPHDTVMGNVYGGGQQAAVNGNTYVNIVKGVIGTADSLNTCPDINGLVFGGSEGLAGLGYHDVGLVRDTAFVTIGTNGGDNTATHVKGAVFGGGDDGQVGEAHVVVHSGTVGLPLAVSEMVDDLTNPVVIYRGNVYGGGRGIDTISTGTHYDSEEGRVRGNTSVTINGGKIYHDVYGAGSLGSVDKKAIVTVNGGEIGMSPDDALTAAGNKRYAGINSGQVFGSGRGVAGSTVFANFATVDSAVVNINGGTIYGLVFGGGANGHVKKSTVVTMTGGTIGIDENAVLGNDGAWYTYRGSLYGGGRGIDEDTDDPHHYSKTAGKVFGNTNVFVSGNSRIYHNVYGGGSIASVGDHNNAQQIDTTGNITVEITGGTIGVNGNNNGHVFGAGRGVPGSDFVKYNYVNHTNVHISDSALVNGSVFGGGENGHVYDSTQVIVSGGTIGSPLACYYDSSHDTIITEMAEGIHIYRGNVYGGGKGTDTLADGSYSNTAGWVRNKTSVIVNGGKIYHNVYGGGSLASVGADSITNSGLSKVVIAGGEIGMNDTEATLSFTPTGASQDTTIDFSGINNGQVFGGGRGEVADATQSNVHFEQMAYVKNTQVTVNNGNIYGAVFGGGANGHVRNNTKVLVAGGTIGHAVPVGDQEELAHDPNIIYYGNVYGGGRGIDHNTSGGLSSTAGLVKGNTEVEITGGTIYHCVYGGGSLANVGEASNENSGLAKVTVTGGTIGTTGKNNGSVFGGARGEAGGVYTDLAYVKNTQVVIGEKNGSNNALTITGSVFGGGANGHVRKNTDVKLYSGTIGTPLTADEMVEADPTHGTTRRHLFRGNVYGGGRGIDHDNLGGLSASAGRVYGNTNITILGGKVYHNVYGGGSLASVGTYTENTSGEMTFTDNTGHAEITIKGGEIGMSQADASAVTGSDQWGAGLNSGQVYGSGRGETGAAFSHYAFTNTTHVTIDSAALVYGAVFGGGANGHVHDSTYVEVKGGTIGIDDITGGGNHFSIYRGNVYGGGRGIDLDGASHVSPTAGQVYGNTRVEISNGGNSIPKIWHNVYGGGSLATVGTFTGTGSSLAWVSGGKTTINISGGVVGEDADNNGRVFGSGRGYAKFDTLTHVYTTYVNILNGADVRGCVFGSGDNGHVYGDAHVIMTGGSVGSGHGGPVNGNLFGGGRGVDMTGNSAHPLSLTAGMVRGDTYVTMSGGSVKNNIYGGGYMASVYGSTHVDVGGTATVGDDANTDPDNGKVFGASRGVKEPYTGVFSTPEYAKIKGNTNVNITGGTIKNNIYGGGLLGAVGDTAKVTLTGVHYTNKNIFGAGQGEDNVDLDKTNADVGKGTVVILDNSTLTGSVYGGGEHGSVGIPYTTSGGKDTPLASVTINNVQISGAVYGGGKAAAVDGDAAVNVNHSAAVIDSVYGGCQTQGVVTGDIAVNLYNGQVNYNVFGGGYGKDTRTSGNVTVTLGQNVATHTDLPKINGDLYGGSAFGNVNDATATTLQTTTLNVLNGTVEGNVYGGGLGRRGATGIEPIAAKVNGEVHVNIGRETSGTMEGNAQVKGNIFGCNNVYGSPQKNTYVDVFKTYMVLTDSVNYSGTNPTYAIDTVFGGGNHADYAPENGLASSKMKARVHIHSCDNSINTLFGAGNAAAAVGDSAVIDGGRIDFVFGGGNGVLQAANIGAGGVSLALHGGNINKYFGGSNHNGTIAGPINLVVDNSRCGTVIDEFFCGGNEAPISGDVITTIECDPTSLEVVTINNLYGGCNMANISGNVELTVKGGRFINIYGGSKGRLADPGNGIVADSANIGGNVTLTMLGGQVGGHFDTFDTIGNIFGGSNILGNIKGKITVNILDTITNGCGFNLSHANVYGGSNLTGYKPTNPKLASPEVNVMHGTVLNVYGGSKGVANDEASGKVVANPVVTIGDRLYPQYQDRPANVQKITFKGQNIGGNVYGGGNAGDVDGNTTVILDGASKVYVSDDVFGGGRQAEVKGNAKVEVK